MEEEEVHRGKRKSSDDLIRKTSKKDLTHFVNYFSELPSLQRIAAVSVAIKLWTMPGVKNELITSFLSDTADVSDLEKRILSKLSKSSLPVLLKTEISYVIPPIKLQLLKAYCRCCRCKGYCRKLCEHYMKGGSIYWTVEGTIDIVKSLIELFHDDNSETDICHLYEAACLYCLEEYISVLWKKIPEHLKRQFRIGRIGDTYKHHIVIYWTSVLENNLDCFLNKVIRIDYEIKYDHNLSIDLNMITCSIVIGSIFGLKYFWKKLTEQEKVANLDSWLLQATRGIKRVQSSTYEKYNESLDVLCFLLSHINDSIRLTEFFQNHSHVLMLLFESWPFQRIFLPTIVEILDYLQEDVYVSVMKDISFKISTGSIEERIFKELWSVSPSRLKRSFLQKELICTKVVLNFLELENLSMALMLLNDASEDEIKKIICFMFGFSRLCSLIYTTNKLNLLFQLLSETTLPPECILCTFNRTVEGGSLLYTLNFNLQDGIQTCLWFNEWHICHEWIKRGKFQTVEIFLNWAFQSVDELQDFKKTKLNPYILFITFIVMCNFELLGQFLNWYFVTEEKIQQFKKDFFHDNNNYHVKSLLSELCFKPSTAWDVLEKFISFYQPSSEEIIELRFIFLNYVEKILFKKCYDFATMLLNWSLGCIDKVKRYKNDFVLSEKGIKKLLSRINTRNTDKEWNDMEDLIKWSLPLSKETITELKSTFHSQESSCKSKSILKVIALLDSGIDYDSANEFKSSSSNSCQQFHSIKNADNA